MTRLKQWIAILFSLLCVTVVWGLLSFDVPGSEIFNTVGLFLMYSVTALFLLYAVMRFGLQYEDDRRLQSFTFTAGILSIVLTILQFVHI